MAPKENVEHSNNLESEVWHQVIQKTPGTLKAAVFRVHRPAEEHSGAAVRLGTPVWRPGLRLPPCSRHCPHSPAGPGLFRQITPRD